MKEIDKIVAVNILMRLNSLGLGQKTLALAAEITPAYLNKLLRGKKAASKSPSLDRIAKALGVEETDLYQDPAISNRLEAKIGAAKSAALNQKAFSKMLTEHLSEAVGTLKERRTLNPEIEKINRLWAVAPASVKYAVLYLLSNEKEYLGFVDAQLAQELRALLKHLEPSRQLR